MIDQPGQHTGGSACLPHEKSYVQMTVGNLSQPSRDPVGDGASLARQCIDSITDIDRFPPRVFVFLTTPAFKPYRPVLVGIRNVLLERGLFRVPFIGSSVAVCVFDGGSHENGALLLCMASRFLTARAAVSSFARQNPRRAVQQLIKALEHDAASAPNTNGNRWMLVFLPGFADGKSFEGYRADEFLAELRDQTFGRIPMFGGVSSGGIDRSLGFQFLENGVYHDAVVAALIDSSVTCGIAMSHGLSYTGHTYRVKECESEGRVISSFYEGTPDTVGREVTAKVADPHVFGQVVPYGDPLIAVPLWKEDRVHVTRSVTPGTVIHLLKPDPQKMVDAAKERMQWLMRRLDVRPALVAGCLGIGSAERYRTRLDTTFNTCRALCQAEQDSRGQPCVGCYMDGEVGVDQLDRSILGNWSTTALLVADDIPAQCETTLGFQALACQTDMASKAESLEKAIAAILESVDKAAYRGGMVSLVLRDGERRWVVAHSALGRRWREYVLPRTRRPLPGDDVLALVAESRKSRFVHDSSDPEAHCAADAVEAGQVVSQCIIPLMDENDNVLGLLQVDLGDMRDVPCLGLEQRIVLEALGTAAAAVLSRAIRTEELVLSRQLDEALATCWDSETLEEAAENFIRKAAQALTTDAHIRLSVPETKKLVLVGGAGQYFDAAQELRRDIDINDASPSAEAFRTGQHMFVNDATKDPAAIRMRSRFRGTPLGDALEKQGSYANVPIAAAGSPPIGVFNISSPKSWFFTETKLRSLTDLGSRLYVLLAHVEHRQVKAKDATEKEFLLQITPRMDGESSVHQALSRQAAAIQEATSADAVSCFLWDKDRTRLVLRAQRGWQDEHWVDAAWYGLNEGVVGRLATSRQALYRCDLRALAQECQENLDKYLVNMFGASPRAEENFEIIALPMHFADELVGIWMLHRKLGALPRRPDTSFSAYSPAILRQAADIVAAYGYAVQRQDLSAWIEREMRHLALTAGILLSDAPLHKILSDLCLALVARQGAHASAVYLATGDHGTLQRAAMEVRDGFTYDGEDYIVGGKSPQWMAFLTGNNQEIRYPCTDQSDPALIRREGLVWRVCLPLDAAGCRQGVLDICWHGVPSRKTSPCLPYHDIGLLRFLAMRCAAAIDARKQGSEREKAVRERLVARQALEGISLYLAVNSHDLSKGIQAINAAFQMLEGMEPLPTQAEVIAAAKTPVGKIMEILKRAKTIAVQLATSQRSLSRLDELIRTLLTELEPSLSETGIQVTQRLDPVTLVADQVMIRDAISNVIDNAVRAMTDTKVPFDHRYLTVSSYVDHPRRLSVTVISDTGVGMTPEQVRRITDWKDIEGRAGTEGLGLFLTQIFCQVHGGRLLLNSERDAGTTATMEIPLSENGDDHVLDTNDVTG